MMKTMLGFDSEAGFSAAMPVVPPAIIIAAKALRKEFVREFLRVFVIVIVCISCGSLYFLWTFVFTVVARSLCVRLHFKALLRLNSAAKKSTERWTISSIDGSMGVEPSALRQLWPAFLMMKISTGAAQAFAFFCM